MNDFHWNTLSSAQKKVLPQLGPLLKRQGFYLAGGTAIALQLGHRRSVDFDWLREELLADPLRLAKDFSEQGIALDDVRTAKGSLHGKVRGVKVSIMEFPYPLLDPLLNAPDYKLSVASLADLACMKLLAMSQRGAKKDFIDIYALLRTMPLTAMLTACKKKFHMRDVSAILLGLSYFDDAEKEGMPVMLWKVSWREVKRTIAKEVGALAKKEQEQK